MIKKLTTAIIVICLIIVAVLIFANYTDPNISATNSTNNSNLEQQNMPTNSTSHNKNTFSNKRTSNTAKNQLKISPEEAKKIAQKYIEEPGDTAGTPRLTKTSDGYEYIVPIINKGADVGYISIDVQTGKNLGGARNT